MYKYVSELNAFVVKSRFSLFSVLFVYSVITATRVYEFYGTSIVESLCKGVSPI